MMSDEKQTEPEVINFAEVDGESLADIIESEQGAAGKPKREKKSFGQAIAGSVGMMCGVLAKKTGNNDFALVEDEYEELVEDCDQCALEYFGESDLPAWLSLSVTVIAIGGFRYMLYQSILLEIEARKTKNGQTENDKKE